MPAKYEAIRDDFIKKGYPADKAKKAAAMIFNSQRKPGEAPVTGNEDGPGKASA